MANARDMARGKWRSIAEHVGGINADFLDGRHHKCPKDNSGENRFRFSDKNGTGNYFCSCSAGEKDGFDLLMCCKNTSFAETAKEVEQFLGKHDVPVADKRPRKSPAQVKADLKRVAQSCLDEMPHVIRYLSLRGITIELRGVLEGRTAYGLREVGIVDPQVAMVSALRRPDGTPETIHLTYLDGDRKASHARSRILMTPIDTVKGCAVRLAKIDNGILGVGEGIESSASAMQLYGIPTWATISANGMSTFVLPTDVDVRELHIFADRDPNFVGQSAAYNLARRVAGDAKTKHIKTVVHVPNVEWPDSSSDVSADYNDILKGRFNGS